MKEFINFKNFLTKSNIFLFDGECRIAHYNYLKLSEQKGGSNNSSDYLANKVKNQGNNMLKIFVYALVNNNLERINFIIEK
jgi:hypothetical protein